MALSHRRRLNYQVTWRDAIALFVMPLDVVWQFAGNLVMTVMGILMGMPLHHHQSGQLALMSPSLSMQTLILDALRVPRALIGLWMTDFLFSLVKAGFDPLKMLLNVIPLFRLLFRYVLLCGYIAFLPYNLIQAIVRGWVRYAFGGGVAPYVLAYESLFKSTVELEIICRKALRYVVPFILAFILHWIVVRWLGLLEEKPLNPRFFEHLFWWDYL